MASFYHDLKFGCAFFEICGMHKFIGDFLALSESDLKALNPKHHQKQKATHQCGKKWKMIKIWVSFQPSFFDTLKNSQTPEVFSEKNIP